MAVSAADFDCSCSKQIFQFKNSRSNVAEGAEVIEQHRDCRVTEYPPELQEQTSSSWWTRSAMVINRPLARPRPRPFPSPKPTSRSLARKYVWGQQRAFIAQAISITLSA